MSSFNLDFDLAEVFAPALDDAFAVAPAVFLGDFVDDFAAFLANVVSSPAFLACSPNPVA